MLFGLQIAPAGPQIGQPAPTFTLSLFDGGELRLSDLRGKVVIINFWASWCVECFKEAGFLEQTWRAYKDKGVVFIGVDYVDIESAARDYMEKYHITYPSGPDKGSRIAQAYRVQGVPETFFIGKDGCIAAVPLGSTVAPKFIGPIDQATLVDMIDKLLKEPAIQ
jgi:cytochrome c biogenesis protein CcmG/thiol:disulfide interchange protein DsbE